METKKQPLDFLVIGAQKCATTWLYECLNEHPEICLPKHKREVEYMGGQLYKENGGQDWYLSLLNHCDENKVKGDVSVEYIINKESPELIWSLNPQIKFILSTRNPANRAVSAMKWYIRKGSLPENEKELTDGFAKAVKTFSPDEDIFSSNIFHDVLHRGLYKKLLEPYYKFFKPDQFLIVHYEGIQNTPQKVLKEIYTFLQVDAGFVPPSIATKPKKNSNNKLLVKIERNFSKNKIVSFLVNKAHQAFPGNAAKTTAPHEKEIHDILSTFYDANNVLIKTN